MDTIGSVSFQNKGIFLAKIMLLYGPTGSALTGRSKESGPLGDGEKLTVSPKDLGVPAEGCSVELHVIVEAGRHETAPEVFAYDANSAVVADYQIQGTTGVNTLTFLGLT